MVRVLAALLPEDINTDLHLPQQIVITLTWLQHIDSQEVGVPLSYHAPAVVVIPPPKLCRTQIGACLPGAGPVYTQTEVTAAGGMFYSDSCS